MNKFTVVAILIIIVAFGGLIFWRDSQNGGAPKDISDYNAASIIAADDNNGGIGDHVRGNSEAKIVLVEYADLQCPGCAAAMPNIHKLYEEYGDRVAFVYRNYPIPSLHPNARAAASAAESAGFQGYYWEMVEAVYSNQASWISEVGTKRTKAFVELFKEIAPEGDAAKFESDMNSSAIETKVNFDMEIARKLDKIEATPAFIVNGKAVKVSDASTQEDLKRLIETILNDALKEAGEKTGPRETEEDAE